MKPSKEAYPAASFNPDWDQLEACRESLREHMKICKELQEENEQLRARLQRAEEALRMILTHDPADGQCDNGYSPEYVAREALTHPDPESEWKQYKRTNVIEMRPYILGEDLAGISVSDQDDPPNDHGMVARNPKNHADQWYVARAYFEENFEGEGE